VAPFTFDGFSFGFGGLLPSNSGLFPFYNNLYQILFRNIFNTGLGQYFRCGAGVQHVHSMRGLDLCVGRWW
jgi:hypothetical protein